ncbi:MAG: hypothetical protein M3Z96_13480 [Pseudomonadota bacterium]|nr:hypothetical protein [Pseudomonadota bacterium]
MTFPTANVTPGSGLTVNTLPNAGQSTMANSLSVAIASDQGVIPIAALPAGTNAIGSITGRTTYNNQALTVTASAYTAGNEVGGLMTFAIGGAGSGLLQSVRVTSKSVQTNALRLFLFTTNPSGSTWTDKTAPAIVAADIASLLCVVPLNTPFSDLGTMTLWSTGAIEQQFVAANLYGVLVTVTAMTPASTSDFTVQIGVRDD